MPTTELEIKQLADNGGSDPIAPITVPEAVIFEDGADLTTAIGSIAAIETSPATAAHNAGDFIVWNGQLYKVTSAIAIGDTLSTSTNVRATSSGNEITSILNNLTATDGVAVVGNLLIQWGMVHFDVPANSYKGQWVNFTRQYTYVPIIATTFETSSTAGYMGRNVSDVWGRTASGFELRSYNGDSSSRAPNVLWLAIGVK